MQTYFISKEEVKVETWLERRLSPQPDKAERDVSELVFPLLVTFEARCYPVSVKSWKIKCCNATFEQRL